jgi:predicted phage tail protein
VSLGWRAVAGATSYLVEAGSSRGASNLGVFNVGNTTSLVTGVPPGVYYVRIRAVNGNGVSGPSNEVAVQVR